MLGHNIFTPCFGSLLYSFSTIFLSSSKLQKQLNKPKVAISTVASKSAVTTKQLTDISTVAQQYRTNPQGNQR
jgi:hypothetical protein